MSFVNSQGFLGSHVHTWTLAMGTDFPWKLWMVTLVVVGAKIQTSEVSEIQSYEDPVSYNKEETDKSQH